MRKPYEQPENIDWDKAYDNRGAVGNAAVEGYIARWTSEAASFRDRMRCLGRAKFDQAYGDLPRQRYDLFLPAESRSGHGLAVFVHGGYWRAFDKSLWSHLAAGALDHGFAVALPSYRLCPEVRISDITGDISLFLNTIEQTISGPIHLAGHSAGGHLAASCVLKRPGDQLNPAVTDRIAKVVSISGLHDLRPLLHTTMNETLKLDLAEARRESPALCEPIDSANVTCWVGSDELPAFREQTALLSHVWHGLGAKTDIVEAPGMNHFSVIEDLANPYSALTQRLVDRSSGRDR